MTKDASDVRGLGAYHEHLDLDQSILLQEVGDWTKVLSELSVALDNKN